MEGCGPTEITPISSEPINESGVRAFPTDTSSFTSSTIPLHSEIMSFSSKNNSQDSAKQSQPIPIGSAHSRRRAASVTSSTSSGSPTEPSEPQTPPSNITPPRMVPPNFSPSNSPILSYFMAQSPTKTTTFPFSRKFGGRPPVFEGQLLVYLVHGIKLTFHGHLEEETDAEVPVATHARRASTTGRFTQQQPNTLPEAQQERGTSLLRRLSLGNALARVST